MRLIQWIVLAALVPAGVCTTGARAAEPRKTNVVLTGRGGLGREAIYWHYPHYNKHPQSFPSGVIRAGDWKLIESFETGELSLYNLTRDIGETSDLSDKEAGRAAQLHARLKRWRSEVGAEPMRPNPEYRPVR